MSPIIRDTGEKNADGTPKPHVTLTQEEFDAGLVNLCKVVGISGVVKLSNGNTYNVTPDWIVTTEEDRLPLQHHAHLMKLEAGVTDVPHDTCTTDTCGFEAVAPVTE